MTATIPTYAVASIKNGTVIDHITAGAALKIIRLLKLPKHSKQVAIGLNLPSKSIGIKDLVKVEGQKLSPEEANQVAIISPYATINIIENYEVKEKFPVSLPDTIENVILCPNKHCVSNHEKCPSNFTVQHKGQKKLKLQCRYCRMLFSQEEIG